ncbi:MAG: hypothetical protein DRO11_07440 [Methanobacteriota archaeon]|nr:MAG: hypothetical protein DRO11_07440 [Euryarchaeota archaeon]
MGSIRKDPRRHGFDSGVEMSQASMTGCGGCVVFDEEAFRGGGEDTRRRRGATVCLVAIELCLLHRFFLLRGCWWWGKVFHHVQPLCHRVFGPDTLVSGGLWRVMVGTGK